MKIVIQSNDFITQVDIGEINIPRLHEIHDHLTPYLTWLPDFADTTTRLESRGVYIIRSPSLSAKMRDTRYNNQPTSDVEWTEEHLALWDEVENIANDISTRLGIPDDVISDKTNLGFQFANFKSMYGWNSSSWWHTDGKKLCSINVIITGSDKDYVTFTSVGYNTPPPVKAFYHVPDGPLDKWDRTINYRAPEFIEAADANIIATYKYTDMSMPVTPTLLNTSIPHKAHSHDEDRIMLRLVFTESTYEQVRRWLESDC